MVLEERLEWSKQSGAMLSMCKVTTEVQRACTSATSAYSLVLKEIRKEAKPVKVGIVSSSLLK